MGFHWNPGWSAGEGAMKFSETDTTAPMAMAIPMNTVTTWRGVRESAMISTLVPACRLHSWR